MKTKMLPFSILFLAICCLAACRDSTLSETKITNDFESFKELAKKHSEGLEYVFNELSEQVKARSVNSNVKSTKAEIVNFAKEYVASDLAIRELAGVSSADMLPITAKTRNGEDDFEATVQLSDAAQGIFDRVMEYFPMSKSYSDFEEFIKNALKCETFNSMHSDEQKLLTFMLCIVLDSSLYWTDTDNFNKWAALASGRTIDATETRGGAGPPACYWMSELSPEQQQEIGSIVKADAIGCLPSFPNPVGWLIGGIVGSAYSMLK